MILQQQTVDVKEIADVVTTMAIHGDYSVEITIAAALSGFLF